MKAFQLVLAGLFAANSAFAIIGSGTMPVALVSHTTEVAGLPAELGGLSVDAFLAMTPSKFEKATGQKLGLKKSIELRAAQKAVKREFGTGDNSDFPKGLYIVLAILGLAWIAMGVMDDFKGNNWWVNLILVILCWIPGVIHALVKMKEYYK